MQPTPWPDALPGILIRIVAEGAAVDRPRVHIPVTVYLVLPEDRSAIQFSVPVAVRRGILEEFRLDPAGSDGAMAALIVHLKRRVPPVPSLGPLAGGGTRYPARYQDGVEPYTVIRSPTAMAEGLRKSDHRNTAGPGGVHLTLRGALPDPGQPDGKGIREVTERLAALLSAGALDILVVQADRILILEGHAARAVDPAAFCRRRAGHLAEELRSLEGMGEGIPPGEPASQDSLRSSFLIGGGTGKGRAAPSRTPPDQG